MKLNIIHDNRMIDRYGLLMEELIKHSITDYQIRDCVQDKDSVVRSINLSHKKIVQYAKDNKFKEICIGEDDLFFSAKDGWEYFLKNKPSEFDLYLGCSFMPKESGKVCGFQLYIISEKFYDAFLSTPNDVHIDTYMDELKGDYKFCYPYPALQRKGWSANNKAEANYSSILKPEDIYQ